jgi:hypothetical protein
MSLLRNQNESILHDVLALIMVLIRIDENRTKLIDNRFLVMVEEMIRRDQNPDVMIMTLEIAMWIIQKKSDMKLVSSTNIFYNIFDLFNQPEEIAAHVFFKAL